MIKASDIIKESWVTLFDKRVEILDFPSSWRSAASAFKKELKDMDSDSQLLRFVYVTEPEDLKVWLGFAATHSSVITARVVRGAYVNMWVGEIVLPDRSVVVRRGLGEVGSLDNIPEKLRQFLKGLRIHFYS